MIFINRRRNNGYLVVKNQLSFKGQLKSSCNLLKHKCTDLEAEKHALLAKNEATWLLSYYRDGGDIQLPDEEVRRLETFANVHGDGREIIIADTICVNN